MRMESWSVLENQQVLIVDDQLEGCFPIIVLLQLYRAEVRAVSSVAEALQVLQCSRVDVLLSDLQLSQEDGYTLIRKVIALFPTFQEDPLP
jgi:CheY-like chemotaxis protein